MRMLRYGALFASLAITLLCQVRSQAPITCTAGYYKPGDKATITCHYYGEINTATIVKAYIQWHELGAGDQSTGKEVVMCHFNGGALQACDREKGYSFVDFHNSNLTIAVDDVSAEFQGRYSCGVVTPPAVTASGRKLHPCLLVVKGAIEPENDVQKSPETHESLHRHVQVTLTLLIIFIIAAASAIVYAIIAHRRTMFPFRKPDTQRLDEENPMMSVEQQTENESENNITQQGISRSAEDLNATEDGTRNVESGQGKSVVNSNKRVQLRQRKLKERLKTANTAEEKQRIQTEFDTMLDYSRKVDSKEEKNRIQDEYVQTMERLNKAGSDEEKQRIQAEYENTKNNWKI